MSRAAVPIAIVSGCGLIAIGLYAGLRSRPVAPPAAAPAAGSAPLPSPADAAPPVPPDQVAAQVAAALEAQRGRFISTCWQPSLAKAAQPARSPYELNFTISAEGKEVARGISELRGQSRADVAQCLRAIHDAPILVAPPGQATTVTLTLWLPQ